MRAFVLLQLLVSIISFSPKVIAKPFPADERRDTTHNVIVIHYDSANTPATTFLTLRHARNAYHYLIAKNGTIYKMIDPKYKGRHAGLSDFDGYFSVNRISIGICLVNNGHQEYTHEQYRSLAWLVNVLQHRYPDLRDTTRIVGHSDVAIPRGRKKDPGEFFHRDSLFVLLDSLHTAHK